jgi:hypothetical protein
MNATANVTATAANADLSTLDSYYQNDEAKSVVNATLTDVSQTFGVDTSILGLLLGANDAQEAQATANAVGQQVNP